MKSYAEDWHGCGVGRGTHMSSCKIYTNAMEENSVSKLNHPVEKLVQTILYKSVEFEVVERPDVIWVGCIDYAQNNSDESDIDATEKRIVELWETVPVNNKINPDWSASLGINYFSNDKPCGMFFGSESYTDKQDERYDIFIQPGGLWLRFCVDENSATQLLGFDKSKPFSAWDYASHKYLAHVQNVVDENGYIKNPDIDIVLDYHCHAEYNTPPHTCYGYIPIAIK